MTCNDLNDMKNKKGNTNIPREGHLTNEKDISPKLTGTKKSTKCIIKGLKS